MQLDSDRIASPLGNSIAFMHLHNASWSAAVSPIRLLGALHQLLLRYLRKAFLEDLASQN